MSEKHPHLLDSFPGLFAQHGARWIEAVIPPLTHVCMPNRFKTEADVGRKVKVKMRGESPVPLQENEEKPL